MPIPLAALVTTTERPNTDWPPGFVGLYQDRYEAMVRLAHLMTGRNDVAEELVQDCFLRVAGRWTEVEQPAAYLRRAVVNACRSHHRGAGRLRPLSSAPEPTTSAPSAPTEIHETWLALARLSPRRRAAVVLRYYEDLPDDEIAALLDCRPATVRSLVHRALSQLEEVLR